MKKLRTCNFGHQYYKSSDCNTCPQCEKENKPKEGFMSILSAPARRALQSHGIDSLEKLSNYSESEILSLHGMGKSSIPKLEKLLSELDLKFK